MLAAIDLEGVLAPEIWPYLGEHFGIKELHLTTRDTADFDELMRLRVDSMNRAGLTLAEVQQVAYQVHPYLGAPEFLKQIRRHCQVMIISDTFHEFATPLMDRLGGVNLFANRFVLDGRGHISGWELRIRGRKSMVVEGMKQAGFKIIGMGDSLNDLSLLQSADYPVLYRPVQRLRDELPNAPIVEGLDEALAAFLAIFRANDSLA
jgi:phosphoserine/homoserine phosphotransferase